MRTSTTTRMKKRKKRTRTGSKLLLLVGIALCTCVAGDRDEKKSDLYAVVAGTVFRDPGFALPGANVTLNPGTDKPKGVKVKKMTTLSDNRGEFAFRVPAAPLRYTITVKANGYRSEEKEAEIQGEQRVDVYFQLKPEDSKQ